LASVVRNVNDGVVDTPVPPEDGVISVGAAGAALLELAIVEENHSNAPA